MSWAGYGQARDSPPTMGVKDGSSPWACLQPPNSLLLDVGSEFQMGSNHQPLAIVSQPWEDEEWSSERERLPCLLGLCAARALPPRLPLAQQWLLIDFPEAFRFKHTLSSLV